MSLSHDDLHDGINREPLTELAVNGLNGDPDLYSQPETPHSSAHDLLPVDTSNDLDLAREVPHHTGESSEEVLPPAATALDTFAAIITRLLPTAGEYQDEALMHSLSAQLDHPAVRTAIGDYLLNTPGAETLLLEPQHRLAINPSTIELTLFVRVARDALNPDALTWVDQAIASARQAPGAQVLSLAISLGEQRSNFTPNIALRLASLLLAPLAVTQSMDVDSLPCARVLVEHVPALDAWSEVDAQKVFKRLGFEFFTGPDHSTLHLSARDTWLGMAQTAQFQQWTLQLLDRMNWYGAKDNELTSPRITQALAARSLVEFLLGATALNPVAMADRFNLWAATEFSHAQLAEQVRTDILSRHAAFSPAMVCVLQYLLLRDAAPELLVMGVPDHLQYGRSLQSVALLHSVALLEALSPGASASASYDELINLSARLVSSTDPAVVVLHGKTLIRPALLYGMAHGAIVIEGNDVRRATPGHIRDALLYLKSQQDAHAAQLNKLLSLQPPDRQKMARKLLTDADVPHWLWAQGIEITHWPILQRYGLKIADTYDMDHFLGTVTGKRQATLLELVMMGEVYRSDVETVDRAYTRTFADFRHQLIEAQTPIIARLLIEMPVADQAALSSGTSDISRVSFAGKGGDYGLFIRCRAGEQTGAFGMQGAAHEHYFQVIPAAGMATRIAQTFNYDPQPDYGEGGETLGAAVARHEKNRQQVVTASLTPLLPMDSDAYLSGAVSRSTRQLHHPLPGRLITSESRAFRAEGGAVALHALAQLASTYLLKGALEALEHEHLHQTDWEATWAAEKHIADVVARLVIPFYGCIKDLAEEDRSAGVIIACAMDVAFALLPMGQFASSTARIAMRAGEMSVLSVTSQAGEATGRLLLGLAQQTAAYGLFDLGKLGMRLSLGSWKGLLELVPALRRMLTWTGDSGKGVMFHEGVYRILDDFNETAVVSPLRSATVDGLPGVSIIDVGSAEAPEFSLQDPYSGKAFGARLTRVSDIDPIELTRVSVSESLSSTASAVFPLKSVDAGVLVLNVAPDCKPLFIERHEGVFDVLVGEQVYHLDTTTSYKALRLRSIEPLSARAGNMQEVENLCRVRRNLLPVPCAGGIKLVTPPPPLAPASGAQPLGPHVSVAFDAREFVLMRLQRVGTSSGRSASAHIDVWVNEGKLCTWQSGLTPATVEGVGIGAARIRELTEQELAQFSLPERLVYRPLISGRLSPNRQLGLPAEVAAAHADPLHSAVPVIELGAIAAGVEDARTLRGARLSLADGEWIFIEPDDGVFYKARFPGTDTDTLGFERVSVESDRAHINDYLGAAEQYRLVRERPWASGDRQNIARLLFDLLDEEEKI
ncbi:MAG TPA: hypothetical protein VGC62_05510, partial [Pseudomonas sp.]|uniref:hypothetical protein n=1 Tax=Pseudomonas sp. TaxID=306 RepID=UPI002ED7CBD6